MGDEEEEEAVRRRRVRSPAGFLGDGYGDDPGRDDEAPHWTYLRVRQAPSRRSPDSGNANVNVRRPYHRLSCVFAIWDAFGLISRVLFDWLVQDEVTGIAMKWTKVLKTGAVEATFMAVDLSTIMFTMIKGQDTLEASSLII